MFTFTNSFDHYCLMENMMDPNAMRVTGELASFLLLAEGSVCWIWDAARDFLPCS